MKEFFKSMFTDGASGGISSNRVFLACILGFILIASTYMVISTGTIPDISDSWVYLVGVFAGAAWGGKAAAAYKAKFENKETEETEQ